MVGRCCVYLAPITFISPVGFSTTRLARVLDSLVRVSRRVGKIHFAKIALSPSSRTRPACPRWCCHPCANRLCRRTTPSWLMPRHYPPAYAGFAVPRPEFSSTASASTISGLLTLFSKCFSSFLHSTCSLSVSHTYLALGEVYLPLRAAIQNNSTLRPAAR